MAKIDRPKGLKDRELQQYYESVIAMFETPGWAAHVEDLKRILAAGNTLDGIKTMEQLNFRLGQIDILNTIIGQPAVVEAAYEVLLDEDNPDA